MIKGRTWIPAIIWIIYLIWFHINNYILGNLPFHFLPAILSYILMTVIVGIWGLLIMPKIYEKRKYMLTIMSILGAYLFYVMLAYLIEGKIEAKYYGINNDIIYLKDFFQPCIMYFILYSIFGTAYYFAAFAGRKEAQSVKMENDFLRAQIDPHFFLNSIQHIIIDIRRLEVNAADNLDALGKMMQYNMMRTGKDGKVPLSCEVQHIGHKIHFYQLRYPGTANINFSYPPIPEDLRIPPLILITLVENALKHGEFNKERKPIDIRLYINDGHLIFVVQNWKRQGSPDMTHSVGLPNLLRRLAMFYGKKFHYDVKEDDETYFTELVIPL
jgi:two-component system, LytTR family, sensor kinase